MVKGGLATRNGWPSWRPALAALGIVASLLYFAPLAGLDLPALTKGVPQLADAARGLITWPDWSALPAIGQGILETVEMAIVGTVVAIPVSFFLSLLCARNTSIHPVVANLLRGMLSVWRAVPFFVWAMLIISMAGLGVLPGVMAIVLTSISYTTKLYAESLEVVKKEFVEATLASGAGPIEVRRYGIIPQAISDVLSNSLYTFESNIRLSTAIGVLGAGGIGYELAVAFRNTDYGRISLILLAILVLVAAVDWMSQLLRSRLV